ncbi:hypothetical protein LL912_08015 [Niabella sp. CC-SYL272]|uniref:hypothetical protein n=1 Tax=Niabella agricola TaxID=2891571 RepID=UPI001F384F09|nr:hypothetical protein [Niabella agricola]MCF3108720.1 hypothetical protein [Niabella agricola]
MPDQPPQPNKNPCSRIYLYFIAGLLNGLKTQFLRTRNLSYFLALWQLSLATANAARPITPNDFKGTDTERIQKAIDRARQSAKTITIPAFNANGSTIWKIDKAILLPSDMTVVLDNCVLQLSDSCRDNLFRSDNTGAGITHPVWNKNIALIGIGNVILKGADNPRATGDGLRRLVPADEANRSRERISYGSDAGKPGRKQLSDWRNFMILMAYVDGFKLKNIRFEYAHAWAVTFERVHHAELSDLTFFTPQFRWIRGEKVATYNNDAINLREGCKYFHINNITGINGDDCIALSALDLGAAYHTNGNLYSYQATSTKHNGIEDDIEHIHITNIKTNYTGVAMRASDSASIHHIFINGVTTITDPEIPPPYKGSPYTILLGNVGYGQPPIAYKIHHIYVSNIIGDGLNLIEVKSPVADCVFMNGVYTGSKAASAITYQGEAQVLSRHVREMNLIKTDATLSTSL